MADDSNDTQGKINEEDRAIKARQHDSAAEKRDDFASANSGLPGAGGSQPGGTDSDTTTNEYGAQQASSGGSGFIGSQSDERDPQPSGFAEQGRGAPNDEEESNDTGSGSSF